jgi:hypothetical protein
MRDRPPEIEMTPDGRFVTPPKPPFMTRLLVWAVLIAVIAGALCVAAFALWLALVILPVALGAAVVAWAAWRFQVWRAGKAVGRRQDMWRP